MELKMLFKSSELCAYGIDLCINNCQIQFNLIYGSCTISKL